MFIIGELINGMYKKVAKAIAERDKIYIQSLAQLQVEAGADALDVNCGPLSRDPLVDMLWLIDCIQDTVSVSLSLDTTRQNIMEEGLARLKKKGIINSTSADTERLEVYLELAKKYNASLIALTMDKKGVPQDKDRRLELAASILDTAQKHNFSPNDIYLDPILLPINVAQNQLFAILEAIRDFKLLSAPSPKTIVGLSNISQGAKDRSLINRSFLTMAAAFGLDSAILDPLDEPLMDSLIAGENVLNKSIYCDNFVSAYKKSKKR
ncbi:MAG: dihydropteroate synthase [Candidatus Omnitrophica bacterium]|nr:dihydropteroate synthase [Candidatus Omnitrophota bacterium]